MTYTDGTTATFTQSISGWANTAGVRRGVDGASTSYRDTSSGTEQAGQFNVYEYTFALDPTKTVRSITLPNDANVEVLAATLVPAGTTQVNLSSAFNRTGIVADGATFGGGGLDGNGTAYSSSLLGTSLTAGGATFNLGPAGAGRRRQRRRADHRPAGGQRLGAQAAGDAVNGSQPNQTFTVTYTDGTTATFTQSISDWAIPQGYAGESTALRPAIATRPAGRSRPGSSTSTSTRSRSTPPRPSAASPCPMTPTSRCWPSTCMP